MPEYDYRFRKAILTVVGDIKVLRGPFWLIYQPRAFRVQGLETRLVSSIVRPGDVLMRSYENDLDGFFIPKGVSRCSHSGVYVGDGVVVHSVAEGAQEIDLIDFCRADRVVVLRPIAGQDVAVRHAKNCARTGVPYNFSFVLGRSGYYCHEFTAACFPALSVRPLRLRFFGFKFWSAAYLADSFYLNKSFRIIYETDGS